MADSDARVIRLLTLIPFIIKNQPVKLKTLSEVFGVSEKELRRDLQLVFLCGVPDYDPGDLMDVRWSDDETEVSIYMADYFSRPLRFTARELAALEVAGVTLQDLAALPEAGSLRSALKKVTEALSSPGATAPGVPVHLETTPVQHLELLRKAWSERRQVAMEYYTWGKDTFSERRLEPYELFYALGNWYVSGWDHGSEEVRVFRLDRISRIDVTGEAFVTSPDPAAAAENLFSFTGGMSREVTLRFDPLLALWASEQSVYDRVEIEPDGSALCTLKTDDLAWLEKELLRLGYRVQVIQPDELRVSLMDRARKILGLYT